MDSIIGIGQIHDSKFLASDVCQICPTREISLFANIKTADLEEMHSLIQYMVYEKGDKLYQIDEKADFIYTLHDGVVKLEQSLPTGELRIVRLLRRGDLVGIEAVTAAGYQHDAIAMTTVSLCKIPAELVLNFSIKSRELHTNLMEKWQDVLTTSDTWLTRLSTGNSRYRVVQLLIWLSENCPHEEFYLPGREDIGNMLSLTTETVSRTIAEIRRDGDLVLPGKDRAKVDVANLKKIVMESE
jgi:CRP-like cAMP-binding protein